MIGDNRYKLGFRLSRSSGPTRIATGPDDKGPDFGPGWNHKLIINVVGVGRLFIGRGWSW